MCMCISLYGLTAFVPVTKRQFTGDVVFVCKLCYAK